MYEYQYLAPIPSMVTPNITLKPARTSTHRPPSEATAQQKPTKARRMLTLNHSREGVASFTARGMSKPWSTYF